MRYISTSLVRLRREVDSLLDALTWSAARGTVDAVRYQPRQLALTIACAASGLDARPHGAPAAAEGAAATTGVLAPSSGAGSAAARSSVGAPLAALAPHLVRLAGVGYSDTLREIPRPGKGWFGSGRAAPLVVKSTRVVHGFVRAAAAHSAWWVGPTASAVVRWLADTMAGAADRVGAATIERPLGGRAHPGMLVPHIHAVAVLAVDMRGFSHLTRALHDSGYLVDLIEEYLSALTRVVERHRGVVFQYTGDGLLALFLPELVGLGSAAMMERLAGPLGAELHEAFDGAHERWRREWHARGLEVADIGFGVGLSFGRATVGVMGPRGKKQVGVIGEPVNLAAFLCSQAPAGAVLVDVGSFTRAGARSPSATIVRLHSKKRHQRIRTFRLDVGRRAQRRRWSWMRGGLRAVDLRWGWPPVELA